MTVIVSVGVCLLALCGHVASFCVAPRHAIRSPAAAVKTTQQVSSSLRPWLNSRHTAFGQDFDAWRGGGVVMTASEEAMPEPEASSDAPESPASSTVVAATRPSVDVVAIAKYIAGTGVEFGIIMGGLSLLQAQVLPRVALKYARAMVFFTFGFLAMKSRTFGVLNARRPKVAVEKEAKTERRRPDWMPPPKVFPFIWITIGILRAVSSTMVWEALGSKLVSTPIAAMVFHLSVGDTWNHINNVEKRLGVAVPVVFLVWLSVANAAFRYYQVVPKAGLVILPSVIWIAVANLLVQSIWRLNGKEPLYPAKKASS